MRASGGTKLGLAASVVDLTRPMMAALTGPSFQEGKGSPGAACARAEVERNDPDKSGSAASPPSTARRLGPDEEDCMIISGRWMERAGPPGPAVEQRAPSRPPAPFVWPLSAISRWGDWRGPS